jgi:hypothetical protein
LRLAPGVPQHLIAANTVDLWVWQAAHSNQFAVAARQRQQAMPQRRSI